MEKRITLWLILMVLAVLCISCLEDFDGERNLQDVTLQPEASFGKDALIMYHPYNDTIKNMNFGSNTSLLAAAWEVNDTPIVTRSLIEFNFSGIQPEAEIIDAKLTLYFNPTDETYSEHSTASGSNAFLIERIIDHWAEDTVTWNNRPETSSDFTTLVDSSIDSRQNYLDIDVTYLVMDIVKNPSESHGFAIRLQTEQYYRSVVLASSDNFKAQLHPKLRIVFKQ